MATTAKRRAANRASVSSRRSASLSLAEGRKRPDLTEHGDSSVSYATGASKIRRLLSTEYLWELRGANAQRTYDRMRFSDPKIAGLRFAQSLPLLRAHVEIQPADAKDKEAVAKADLVRRLLLEDFPWRAFLADTTLAKDYGFSAHEIVWRNEEGEARFRLALRPASSIRTEDIYLRDGKIDHVVQHPLGGGELTIPGDSLIWFCHQKEGDDFVGRSILRPMYKPWKLKEEEEVNLALLIGKMAGVPVFTYHNELDDETKAMLEEAGESFGIAAGAFVKKPEDVDLELLVSGAKCAEVLEAIRYWDTQLTDVCQAQVLDLGTSQVGSRALGSTLLDMFNDSVQVDASYREDVLNAREGLIHQIISYNFANDDLLPKLRFGNVQRADIRALAEAMLKLNQAGMQFGEETWDFIRGELNLPETDTTQAVVPGDVPKAAPEPQLPPPAPTSPEEPGKAGAQASEHNHEHGLRLAERREPRGVEVYLALAEIEAKFDTAKTAVQEATKATREALTRELVKRARAAVEKGKLNQFADNAPPMLDKLGAQIEAVLLDFYKAGRRQVADELERQRQGKPWTPESIRAAETPVPGPSPEGLEALKEQARAMARAIGSAVQAAIAAQAARMAARTPVEAAAMVAAAMRESDAAALRFGALASDFLSMGRSEEAKAEELDIEDAVYSALLDKNTCEECEAMDGEVTTDLGLAESWAPNPSCYGGGACRCLVAFELRQEA